MIVELNDEVVLPLINDLKKDTRENQNEVLNLLDIEAVLKLLTNMNEILATKKDNELKRLAVFTYKILLKRISKIMKNKNVACSKEDKKHIYELYSVLLEDKPQKNRIKVKNY